MRLLLAAATTAAALVIPPGIATAAPACGGATAATGTTCVFQYAGGHLVYWAHNARLITGGALIEDRVTIRVYNETRQDLVGLCTAIGYEAGCGGVHNMGSRLMPGDVVRCTVTSYLAVSTQYACG